MSDCSTNAMSATKPLEGQIVWKGDMLPTPLNYARYVNGVERVAERIEFDGERYERVRECENVDRHPFIRFKCSECGCLVYFEDLDGEPWLQVDGVAETPRFCPLCGARVKEGGDGV